MRTKSTRRRNAIWWCFHACTLVVLLLLAASIWPKPYVYYKSPTNAAGVSTGVSFVLLDGVMMNAYWKEQPPQPRNKPSTMSGFGSHGALAPAWYMPPVFQPGYIKLPLVYPAALLLLGSVWLFRSNRATHPTGHCADCGYNLAGLGSGTCPECGASHA